MVDVVSTTIHKDWEEVFMMGIIEFLNIFSYTIDKANWEKKQIDQYKQMISRRR